MIANNIANVQTPGFRASRVEFADLLYRQLVPEDIGLPPDDTSVLPTVGTGVTVLATTPSQRPGAQVPTARPLDIAIDGSGFFVVRLGAWVGKGSGAVVVGVQDQFARCRRVGSIR